MWSFHQYLQMYSVARGNLGGVMYLSQEFTTETYILQTFDIWGRQAREYSKNFPSWARVATSGSTRKD